MGIVLLQSIAMTTMATGEVLGLEFGGYRVVVLLDEKGREESMCTGKLFEVD